jgi:phenylalanyl-tRNA synthetase beta subunit
MAIDSLAQVLGSDAYIYGGLTSYISPTTQSLVANGRTITFDSVQCNTLLFGEQTLSDTAIDTILGYLHCMRKNNLVAIPRRRGMADVTIAEGIYEEIARIYGYNAITPLVSRDVISYIPYTGLVALTRACERVMTDRFHADQLQTYPWYDWTVRNALVGYTPDQCIALRNPVSPEQTYLRPSIIPNLVEFARKNAPQYTACTLYDIGQIRDATKVYGRHLNKQAYETTAL